MPATKPQTTIERIKALSPDYVMSRQGKEGSSYAGLLALVHDTIGIKSQRITLLQAPTEANGNTAISHAHIEYGDGTVSEEIGDANPINVGKMIALHIIRMSATRAKVRAHRDRLNVGGAALEEFGPDDDEDQLSARPAPARQAGPHQMPPPAAGPATHAAAQAADDAARLGERATPAQRKRLETLYRLLSIPLAIPESIALSWVERQIAELEEQARTTDATQSHWKGLMEQGEAARKATGYLHTMPDAMTIAEYERHMREVVKHQPKLPAAPESPPSPAVPASAQPATPQQKERLAKLQASLGQQVDPAKLAHLSFEAAANAITEAVQAFNSKSPAQQASRQPVAAR